MNPCGAICDWGRRPYRTRARFRKGDPTETGIRWYICDHDAHPLPFPSAIVNSDWEDNDLERDYGFDPANIGEARGAPKSADFKNQPQGHTGAHQCGQPSWYVQGLPSSPPGVPVVYNADGLPVCCAPGKGLLWGRAPTAPRGGLLWYSAPSASVINGTDTCPGPDLTVGVLYQQQARLMGTPGTGIWFRAPAWVPGLVLDWFDLGGTNTVAGVAFWQAPTGDCSSILFLTFVAGASGSYSNPVFPGATLWAVVIPTTTGAGQPVPEFTIRYH